jgi:hypothetical protein
VLTTRLDIRHRVPGHWSDATNTAVLCCRRHEPEVAPATAGPSVEPAPTRGIHALPGLAICRSFPGGDLCRDVELLAVGQPERQHHRSDAEEGEETADLNPDRDDQVRTDCEEPSAQRT